MRIVVNTHSLSRGTSSNRARTGSVIAIVRRDSCLGRVIMRVCAFHCRSMQHRDARDCRSAVLSAPASGSKRTCHTATVPDKRRLDDVFGVARDIPVNYVIRDAVDGVFVSSLARDKHIVVFGSSKQGKTCLRKSNLNDDDYIVVTCSNKWTLSTLHSAILKAAGYTIEQSSTRTADGSFKINAKLEGSAGVPLLAKAKAGGDAGYQRTTSTSTTTVALELDPADVNDIIGALAEIGFGKFIVLEDFHYLSDDVQQDFAVALKAFHESSQLTFIVVGVWLDENRLVEFNGDLTERVLSVNADVWSPAQLSEVVERGEKLLNIEFDPAFRDGLIQGCFESVSIVQTACHQVAEAAGISATVDDHTVVGTDVDAFAVIRDVVDKQSARYSAFLQKLAGGFQDTSLQMYRWLLLPVLIATADELEAGLTYGHITRVINANHTTGKVNAGNINQALKSVASLQVKVSITPIILDYDQTDRKLKVVDRGFLIWLNHQDRGELLAEAELPDPRAVQPTLLEEPANSSG